VMTLGSSVRGHVCPPGQLAHLDQGLTRCCKPVDCEQHHFVKLCTQNGTNDTCEECPRHHKLFKRTSSFAYENCHPFALDEECNDTPGVCVPCPRGTVQDQKNSVKLCRPQTKIGLAVGAGQRRRHDVERSQPLDGLPMSDRRNDNDNTSDNSCCACADSCLATSKPGSSNSGKSGASNSNGIKQPLPNPAVEAHWNGQYMNMNGKAGSGSPGHGSFSEPFYNSISHDGPRVSDGDMATYKNLQGTATMLKQDDFYSYPNKVHLPNDYDKDSLKKQKDGSPQEPRKMGESKDSDDYTETDPLLPVEDPSRNGTPVMVSPNRPVTNGNLQTEDGVSAGNRPHLSMLLASVDERPKSTGEDPRTENLPCLRARPELNHSAVTMEELKPVMPLNPNPPRSDNDTGSPKGQRGRGSPARIKPSRQEEVPRKGAREVTPQRPVQAARPTNVPVTANIQGGAAVNRETEETFRKEVLPGVSPEGGNDDTARKSVGGSSGLGESLDISSPISMPSDLERQSRAPYRRSISEASRSVSPSPVPLPRSISSPEEKPRNVAVAVVKPMQSDQSLNNLMSELNQPLDSVARHYPLHSARVHGVRRELSQDSSTDDPDMTRPKTPDRLSEEEDEGEEEENSESNADDTRTNERTRVTFFGNNDADRRRDGHGADKGDSEGKDKSTDRGRDG
ncbi:hypothetical protein BaRGS_00014655, partial [Batillaria attramentaria]